MIGVMRRLLHTGLGVWFLIVMTMAQSCAGPAQNASAYGAHEEPSAGGGSSSQFGYATAPQNSNRSSAPADTSGYVADSSASSALTDYLKHHRLPLVGAQVLRDPNNGGRSVVLYGFVGSDYGKSDAQRQAEDFINDPAVDVDNRIRVNPELLAAGGSPPEPADSGAPNAQAQPNEAAAQAQANASMPGVQSYIDQQNQGAQVQQYQQQNPMTSMSSMLPLIALLGMLSMANGGGSFSTGPSMGNSPYGYAPNGYSPYGYSPYGNSPYGGSSYGNSPYNQYTPYGSPGMPPSTFGSPGYGYSPPGAVGVTPFGTLPGSPYTAFH
jgi:hypothetical protein